MRPTARCASSPFSFLVFSFLGRGAAPHLAALRDGSEFGVFMDEVE
jgi:hypothetical protein